MTRLTPAVEMYLSRLPTQQKEAFLALLGDSDEESVLREIKKHPYLMRIVLGDSTDDLDLILKELRGLTRNRQEMPYRIVLCDHALRLVRKIENVALWGFLHIEIANSLLKSPQGSPEENLEQAIGHYEQVLTQSAAMNDQQVWADIHYSLGCTYGDRIRGERADNQEQAIAHYNKALTVYTREANPADWAATQQMLGNIYCFRIRDKRVDNQEQAIAHYNKALTVYTREAFPERWAGAQACLGVVYNNRIRDERADNQEQAIAHYNKALTVYTCDAFPGQWANTQHHLGATYGDRIRGERADNQEQAIAHFNQALQVRTRETDPAAWAATQHNLGTVHANRIRGERADNQEQAIAHFNQALQVRTRETDPAAWAETQHNLAAIYVTRIRGEEADNQEQAIARLNELLKVQTRDEDPQAWADIHHSLAVAYMNRLLGNSADNLEETIAHCLLAIVVYTREATPVRWAATQHSLGNAYADRRLRGKRVENLEQALKHYKQALQVRTLRHFPADFQQTQRDLGHLHFGEGAWVSALAAYQEAIRAEQVLLDGAYTETGRQAEVAKTSELYVLSAYALLKLGRIDEGLVQLEQGKTRLMSRALALKSVDVSVLSGPDQDLLRSLRQTLRALETEMRLSADIPARRDERELTQALDQVRTGLRDVITRVRTIHPDFMPDGLGLSDILSLVPPKTALVAPLITTQGSVVFVVPSGLHWLGLEQVLWIDGFKKTDLQVVLRGLEGEGQGGGWVETYVSARRNITGWFDTIEVTGKTLWTQLMAPIAERLATLQVTQVLFLPQGGLGLLPLHAAWHEVEGERRYFVDDVAVTYLPSAYAHKVSLGRVSDPHRLGGSLLAVINPTEDLPFTPAEGQQVASLFENGKTTVLSGVEATGKTILKREMAGYVHFSCHGFYRWDDPMQSGLELANHEPFTLAQIIGQLNLDKTRLVTLSACETGITDVRQSPDEYIGLSTGFLQAGAPAVVSTLWAVDDLSTMLLMERFYRLHLQGKMELPHALRQAQVWLREVTACELAERFADEEEAMLSSTRLPIETASAYFARFTTQDPCHRPFAHPYYWAAFTFSGA